MTKVKICGITNADDAKLAISAGADYVGLIFGPSKRQIIKETAQRIVSSTPDFKNYVGVFLNGKKKQIEEISAVTNIRILQFHGEETPAFCNYFINRGFDVIKVFRVKDAHSMADIELYDKVSSFFCDSFSAKEHGGTGTTFDWTLLAQNSFLNNRKVFVSGGLDQDNVCDAIKAVRPYAVDASSRLESSLGIKDSEKVYKFVQAVQRCDNHG